VSFVPTSIAIMCDRRANPECMRTVDMRSTSMTDAWALARQLGWEKLHSLSPFSGADKHTCPNCTGP
jgi:hypothetical protein